MAAPVVGIVLRLLLLLDDEGIARLFALLIAIVAGAVVLVAAMLVFLGVVLGDTAIAATRNAAGVQPSEVALAEIPPELLALYQRSAQACDGLPWTVLAGIGYMESGHASHGGATIGADGRVTPPIIGIPLDGTNDTKRISDTDGGALDRDAVWDRAVGPFQFIPSSWKLYGVDGNGDGYADPHNIYDAVPAAVRLLCPDGSVTDVEAAVFAYNNSDRYVSGVMAKAREYTGAGSGGVIGPPTGQLMTVRGIEVDSSIAANLEAMLAQAEADLGGSFYTGGGYRSNQRQIELRMAHCGTSHYAIYEMPSSQCTPPTARPGQSMHEQGLAIDFSFKGSLIRSQQSQGFRWLQANAARYGFSNFEVEPWHWSTDGT